MPESMVYLVAALTALLATLSVTELVRATALRLRAVDRPGGRRVHRRPTARLGGLGIWWGLVLALGVFTYGHPSVRAAVTPTDPGLFGLLAGASAMLIVGLLDDLHSLAALHKLGLQTGAALVLVALGWRVETLGVPGVGTIAVGVWSVPLTVAWVVLVTNAVNLIDGLDGLACGLALVASLATAAMLAPGGGPLLLVAAALCGALAGFLWFNLSPALIFMGDAGSLLVGFLLAGLTLRAGQIASPEAFPLVPGLLLAVPLYDTLEAVRRRTAAAARESHGLLHFVVAARARVFAPDGHHLHHRLLRAGLSVRRAAGLLWSTAAAFALTALALLWAPRAGVPLLLASALASAWGLREVARRLARSAPAAVERVRPLLTVLPSPPPRPADVVLERADAWADEVERVA